MKKVNVNSLSHVQLFVTLWTAARHAPLSMGILQARIVEWVAISFSRRSSWPQDQTQVSCIEGRLFTLCAIKEAPSNQKFLCKKYIINRMKRLSWNGKRYLQGIYLIRAYKELLQHNNKNRTTWLKNGPVHIIPGNL